MSALRLVSVDGSTVSAPRAEQKGGFVSVPNSLFDALLASNLTGRQLKIALAVVRKTNGFGKREDDLTIQQLADITGMHRPNASTAFNSLVQANVLSARKGKYGFLTSVNPPESWQLDAYQNNTDNDTTVSKRYERPYQNDTHNRQSQKTIDDANASLSAETANQPATTAKKRSAIPCPHQELIGIYHEEMPENPEVREWNQIRQRLMQSRWKEKLTAGKYKTKEDGLAYWRRYFAHCAKSSFLTGNTDGSSGRPPFIASMEWLIRPSNFAKVVEGAYHQESGK
jgi:phage replication O-like protein O